jgi:hypothetical protein
MCERSADGSSSEIAYPSEEIFSEVRGCAWLRGGDTSPFDEYERRDRADAIEPLRGVALNVLLAAGGLTAVGLGASSELWLDAYDCLVDCAADWMDILEARRERLPDMMRMDS